MINQREFVDLVVEATQWAELPFNVNLLSQIFTRLDTDRDGYITYLQYFQFLLSILGLPANSNWLNFFNGMFAVTSNDDEDDFYDRVWNELRQLFNSYLRGGARTLGRSDIKLLIGDILKEQSQQELDYVFWNYFRVDKDGNEAVEFEEFVNIRLYRLPSFSITLPRSLSKGSTLSKTRGRAHCQCTNS